MSKIKVVICEDHALFREGIKSYLNNREDMFCIGEAENGAQLFHMLRKSDPERFPDIVLLDINMPVMDGTETLQRLKEEFPDLKVIMLTMHNEVSMVEKMMSLGANSYVPKNEAADQIVKAILSVHRTDYYFNDLINQALVQSVRKTKHVENKEQRQDTNEEHVVETNWFVEEPSEIAKKSMIRKIVVGAMYGLAAAAIISIIVYAIIKISANLSSIGQTSF